jgi:hypothetical protein
VNWQLTLLLLIGTLSFWVAVVGLMFMASLVSRSIDVTARGVERLFGRRRPPAPPGS